MGLLKLSQKKMNFDPVQKAVEVLNSIPSKHLILQAYLFGSAVQGVFTEDSDLDFVVVVKDEAQLKQLRSEVYKFKFTDIAVDWIFKLENEFESSKDFGGVCFEAFHHGKKLL